MSSRTLNAEHQPRTLRIASKLDEPQRISRADEATLTERVRRAEQETVNRSRESVAVNLARLEDELRAELITLRNPRMATRRQTYRDLGQSLTLIGKVRRALTPVS